MTGTGRAPLIAVCLRHADRRPEVDPLTGEVRLDARSAGPGDSDLAALELGLRAAEAWAGRVLAVVAGGPDAEPTLRMAATAGAEVLRVVWPPAHSEASHLDGLAEDGAALARALVTAVRAVGEPDLVLCGDRSDDRGTGSVPGFVAAELGVAQALGLVELVVEQGEGRALRAQRRLDGGRREVLRVQLPAVCSVEAAGIRLRRAALPDVLAAGRAAVPVAEPRDVPADRRIEIRSATAYRPRTRLSHPAPVGSARERLLALTGALAPRSAPTVLGPLDPAEAATALLDWLAERGYLDSDSAAAAGSP